MSALGFNLSPTNKENSGIFFGASRDRLESSGGAFVELYADRDQAVSVGRCRLGMSAITRVMPVNVLVSLGNGLSSAETQRLLMSTRPGLPTEC